MYNVHAHILGVCECASVVEVYVHLASWWAWRWLTRQRDDLMGELLTLIDKLESVTTRPLWRVSSAHAISTAPLKPDWGFSRASLSLKAALITLYVKLLSPTNWAAAKLLWRINESSRAGGTVCMMNIYDVYIPHVQDSKERETKAGKDYVG